MIIMFEKIVEAINKLLPGDWLPADKKAHLVCGFLISLIVGLLDVPLTGFWLGTAAAVAKEVRDELVYGGFDYKDLAVTEIGVLLAYLILIILG
jgi:hypothetical protein